MNFTLLEIAELYIIAPLHTGIVIVKSGVTIGDQLFQDHCLLVYKVTHLVYQLKLGNQSLIDPNSYLLPLGKYDLGVLQYLWNCDLQLSPEVSFKVLSFLLSV